MIDFAYARAADSADAVRRAGGAGGASRYLGGGTNLVDLMRKEIERPDTVIDVSGSPPASRSRKAAAWSSAPACASAFRCCRRRS